MSPQGGQRQRLGDEFTWTDPKPVAGQTSYYYVRGEQAKQGTDTHGELVWASPMWIKYQQ